MNLPLADKAETEEGNMKKQKFALGLAVFVLILVFEGCGNKGTGDPTSLGGVGSIGIRENMIQIPKPSGAFSMGQTGIAVAMPVHDVTLTQGFYIARYQVTQKQWRAVMGEGEDRTTSTIGKGDNYPVYFVSWYDALVFCNKLSMAEGLTPAYRISGSTNPNDWGAIPTGSNATWDAVTIVAGSTGYRLPTEAEWEYACRAGTITAWYTGGTEDALQAAAWYNDNAGGKTHEVGQKTPNNFGLYDMHGNVFEWCWDWYGEYSGNATDPKGPGTGTSRVLRGGSWSGGARSLRSAYRGVIDGPGSRNDNIGFRLVRP